MGKGRKCARGYVLQSGPEGPSWCRSRSRPGRSKRLTTYGTIDEVFVQILSRVREEVATRNAASMRGA